MLGRLEGSEQDLMPRPRLTLEDLRELCDTYVPNESRHDNSWDSDEWWCAHEIGHLLTVAPSGIGAPQFGLSEGTGKLTEQRRHELLCRELAAMHVSRRLLTTASRADLVNDEQKATAYDTLYYDDRGDVRRILAEHGCLRLPTTRTGLELRLQQVTETYRGRVGAAPRPYLFSA
ncbi:MAG TPA: hypothetical protein VFP84_07450 [Kofleriaceae bacterium]|nr:hypothetical protein [Kofleriaceae bacterium]